MIGPLSPFCYGSVVQFELEPPFTVIKPEMSEEDFYRLAGEDSDWEYLDGRIVMYSPATDRHEDVFRFLLTLLSGFAGERGGAVVRGSRYPMRLDPRWSPEPDILVVRAERRYLLKKNFLDGRADLVVEITSESDPRFEAREKLPRYREAGIDEIWLVNPLEGILEIDVREGREYARHSLHGGRFESRVVAGFWVDVAWLWEAELRPPLACLREILAQG